MYIYIYMCTYIHIYRAGIKKRKVIRNFFEIATQFGAVIRNCESLFATYSHFCIIYIKRKILPKIMVRTKKEKRSFCDTI